MIAIEDDLGRAGGKPKAQWFEQAHRPVIVISTQQDHRSFAEVGELRRCRRTRLHRLPKALELSTDMRDRSRNLHGHKWVFDVPPSSFHSGKPLRCEHHAARADQRGARLTQNRSPEFSQRRLRMRMPALPPNSAHDGAHDKEEHRKTDRNPNHRPCDTLPNCWGVAGRRRDLRSRRYLCSSGTLERRARHWKRIHPPIACMRQSSLRLNILFLTKEFGYIRPSRK